MTATVTRASVTQLHATSIMEWLSHMTDWHCQTAWQRTEGTPSRSRLLRIYATTLHSCTTQHWITWVHNDLYCAVIMISKMAALSKTTMANNHSFENQSQTEVVMQVERDETLQFDPEWHYKVLTERTELGSEFQRFGKVIDKVQTLSVCGAHQMSPHPLIESTVYPIRMRG